jgi:integrase
VTQRKAVRLSQRRGYWFAWWYDAAGKRREKGLGRCRDTPRRDALKLCDQLAEDFAIEPRKRSRVDGPSIESFRAMYLELRPTMSPATRENVEQAFALLALHLGETTPIGKITERRAVEFRNAIGDGRKLATVRKIIRTVKAIFGEREHGAVGLKLIADNPFRLLDSASVAGVKGHVIDDDVRRVMAELPPHLRPVLALARWGGLRVPSEVEGLRWADIAWQARRFVVADRKRSRVEQGLEAQRTVMLDPRLEAALLEARELAPPRTELVCPALPHKLELAELVRAAQARAGVEKWPKLFQRLRQSCENDWREKYPAHVVATWMGHSAAVGERHYASVDERYYESGIAGRVLRENCGKTPVVDTPSQDGDLSKNAEVPN